MCLSWNKLVEKFSSKLADYRLVMGSSACADSFVKHGQSAIIGLILATLTFVRRGRRWDRRFHSSFRKRIAGVAKYWL